jgi:hypothetical protein
MSKHTGFYANLQIIREYYGSHLRAATALHYSGHGWRGLRNANVTPRAKKFVAGIAAKIRFRVFVRELRRLGVPEAVLSEACKCTTAQNYRREHN